MDYKQIQELIKTINRSNIGELSIEDRDFKITIKQKKEQAQQIVAMPQQASVSTPVQSLPSLQQTALSAALPTSDTATPAAAKTDNLITIKSPMIGTFYRKASPDKPSMIEVGDDIAPGKVVCIIEAMKLFNEIESEISGKIVKVLVENASPVEYDQPLFLVDPA